MRCAFAPVEERSLVGDHCLPACSRERHDERTGAVEVHAGRAAITTAGHAAQHLLEMSGGFLRGRREAFAERGCLQSRPHALARGARAQPCWHRRRQGDVRGASTCRVVLGHAITGSSPLNVQLHQRRGRSHYFTRRTRSCGGHGAWRAFARLDACDGRAPYSRSFRAHRAVTAAHTSRRGLLKGCAASVACGAPDEDGASTAEALRFAPTARIGAAGRRGAARCASSPCEAT